MYNNKFAFESGAVSIAFRIEGGLGDFVIAKKVFEAVIELVPDCQVDIFYNDERAKTYIEAFYSSSKNFNSALSIQLFIPENILNYDAVLQVSHLVVINYLNERLKNKAPDFFQRLNKISRYTQNFGQTIDLTAVVLRNITRAHILGINRYTCLSCDGALPIYDNRVEISLSPKGERGFKQLGLSKNYITVGSNMIDSRSLFRHALKEWSTAYATEYISLLNIYLPQIEVVQIGGGGVEVFKNADRHIFDADLEIVKHVLKNSLLHVDCESGLVHLATQLGTKCLVLFGPTDEKYYGFKENLNLVSDICRPCVWAWDNGSTCLRGAKEPPCMLSISPQTVCEVTCNYINHLEVKNKA
ncbi:MAG: hypothetical protein IKT98_11250 [Selenomonadaceae bacterium]|nr:hypothetical protein [Selenomonadaceae bacterium]